MTDNGNPLLQDWQTPYQLPPFQQIQCEHFAPAFAVLFEQGSDLSVWRSGQRAGLKSWIISPAAHLFV